MPGKVVKSALPETGPEATALVIQLNQELLETNRSLQKKLAEVSQTLNVTSQELKAAKAEKEKVALFLDNILDSLSSGVLVLDLEGKITLFNKAAQNITGYSLSEVDGWKYSEIFASRCDSKLSPLVTLQEGKTFSHQEKEFTAKSGEKLTLGFTTTPLKDSSGNLLGVVEVFVDLSKIKRLEEEIARVKTLAAVGEMAAMISHEIRNPLGGIAGFTDLLDKDTPPSDPRKKYVQKVMEGVEILNKTVGNLLAYAKPIKLFLREVKLTEYLDEVIGLFEMELKRSQKQVTIHKNYLRKELTARIDPEQFQQVILNVLQNASQAVADKGKVDLTLDTTLSGREQQVYLKVSDNGPGMSLEVLKKIFTPFFTSKETGTGLGLATVKKIVEAHRGEVKVKSEVGKGTQVEIWLPRE